MAAEGEECGWTTLWWGSVQEEREEVPAVLHLLPWVTSIQELTHVNTFKISQTQKPQQHIFSQLHLRLLFYEKQHFCFFTINGPIGVHYCLPALLGTKGGRLVGALQGYEGGNVRRAGEGTGANLGGGGGRLDGKLGAKAAGRGGGGGGGGVPSALSLK